MESTQTSATCQRKIINERGACEQAVLCVSPALGQIPYLENLLGVPVRTLNRWQQRFLSGRYTEQAGAVLAWGNKPSAVKAVAFAARHQLPVLRLEDGFLRSVGLGADEPPLSIVLDDSGIYYDARQPSRLEALIPAPLSKDETLRAQRLINAWRQERVSKYNHAEEFRVSETSFVLVIDQTWGDASIRDGLASPERFIDMLRDALEQYPDDQVLVKTHPDVVAGLKQGYFSQVPPDLEGRFRLLGENVHVPALLEHAQAVFCVTSQVGFEALLWGKPVHVYGLPFYAGWGLTSDAVTQSVPLMTQRRRPVSLEQLVYASLIAYSRYIHPETGHSCEVEDVLQWMGEQRRQRIRYQGCFVAHRWPRWKKPVLRLFLQGAKVQFTRKPSSVTLPTIGWGAASSADFRVEDGFIRSVGLGADLTLPKSWVIDDLGMYYDATRPSRLERTLAEHVFTADDCVRGAQIRELLLQNKVTKYNVGTGEWKRPETAATVILVPGQVESDASIKFGSPVVRTNLQLLQAVRQSNPNAHIVYKPHPDVVAGLRIAGEDKGLAGHYCDEIITEQDMAWMLGQVDEVHTMTSLTGFEALLRGLAVVCYGQPFYAGWGLTTDIHPPSRRERRLTLDELVFATLVLYPGYINYKTGRYTTVEAVIAELADTRSKSPAKASFKTRCKRYLLALNRF